MLLLKLSRTILPGTDYVAVGMVRQHCLDDTGWLNVALTIVSVNG